MRIVHKGTHLERFNQKYQIVKSGCWEWQFGLTSNGYGKFTFFGKTEIASRVSYMLFIDDGLNGRFDFVCHKCDNPKCVNPFHLFLGTPKDNTQDALKKGRCRKPFPHPSDAWYKHHGCRCLECKEIHSKAAKKIRDSNLDRTRKNRRDSYNRNKEAILAKRKTSEFKEVENAKRRERNRLKKKGLL